MSRTRGANGSPPASSPAASPRHRTTPSGVSAKASSGSAASAPSRRAISGATACSAAARRRFLQRGRAPLGLELDAGQSADEMALDRHRPVGGDAGQHLSSR